jgi:predicted MFS family arabinose efflux permease
MKKNERLLLFTLGFMAFWANGDNYAVAPLIINIARDFSVEVRTAAVSVTAYMLSFGLFTIFLGPLSERFGKSRILNITAFGTALFSILGGFAFNVPSLIVFRAFNGAFAAGIFPVTMALIGDVVPEERRQASIGRVMGMMFLGGASATLVGGFLAQFGSWRFVYIFYGIAEFALAFVMLRVLPRQTTGKKRINIRNLYATALRNRPLVGTALKILLVGFAVFGTFTYTGAHLKELFDLDVWVIGLVVTSFGVGTVIGGRIAPAVRTKLGAAFLPVAASGGIVALPVFGLVTSPVVSVIALFIFGVSFVFLQSTLVMRAQSQLPSLKGVAMSLASFNMFVGGAVGTAVNGMLFQATGAYTVAFVAAASTLLVLAIISLRQPSGPGVIPARPADAEG